VSLLSSTCSSSNMASVEDAPDESIDENGLYKDVEVQDVTPKPTSHICDKIRDVNEFFSAAVIRVGKSGKSGPHRACKLCSCVCFICIICILLISSSGADDIDWNHL
jgi:hypothetical protein